MTHTPSGVPTINSLATNNNNGTMTLQEAPGVSAARYTSHQGGDSLKNDDNDIHNTNNYNNPTAYSLAAVT